MIDFNCNYFELLDQPVRFAIDADALERAFRALQSKVHPDRFAAGTDAQRRVAQQSSARVNEAHAILRDPAKRAHYLLGLQGIKVDDETDTQLPISFLEVQLERREAAADAMVAGEVETLERLQGEVRAEVHAREIALTELLDRDRAFAAARTQVRELTFLNKLAADLDAMAAAVDEL